MRKIPAIAFAPLRGATAPASWLRTFAECFPPAARGAPSHVCSGCRRTDLRAPGALSQALPFRWTRDSSRIRRRPASARPPPHRRSERRRRTAPIRRGMKGRPRVAAVVGEVESGGGAVPGAGLVSVAARGYWRPRQSGPFPPPAHRTGRALLTHPALGLDSRRAFER